MNSTTKIIPAEHDAAQFALLQKVYEADDKLTALRVSMHHMAGDEKRGHGRNYRWTMTWAQVARAMDDLVAAGDVILRGYSLRPSEVWAKDRALVGEIAELNAQAEEMEQAWLEHRWTRWYPCLNDDGHVHSSLRDCPTVDRGLYRTSMGWETRLSGKTVEEAIAELGPRLCSVCFPDAPAEHCRSLRDITRAGREAEAARKAAEKAAALAPKMLTSEERAQFTYTGSERVTKVAHLLAMVSSAVEERVRLEWISLSDDRLRDGWTIDDLARRRGNQEENARRAEADAAKAQRILIAREAAHPGWGATAAQVEKRRAARERSERRDYGI